MSMGKRHEDRYGRHGYRRDREQADDRGYMERAGDEVRSWFGDDQAERRRQMDEHRDREHDRRYGEHEGRYGSDWRRSDWNPGNWERDNWMRARDERSRGRWDQPGDERSRSDWDRANWNQSAWNRPENWRERDREQSMYRDRGSTWSADDGRMEFGGSSAAYGNYRDDRYGHRDDERYARWLENRAQEDRSEHRLQDRWRDERWRDDRGYDERWQEQRSQESRWGRGPKGYQRPDTRIHEDVCDRLTYSDVDAEGIEVSVANAEVTLSGTVRDRWDKRRAEDIVEEITGVRDVHNHIRVSRESRGIGQSEKSASDQPGTVLGVNPTTQSNITSTAPSASTPNTGGSRRS
jgi:osmotically-inducible protein OsmY